MEIRCTVCFRIQDSKAEFIEHQQLREGFSKAAAGRNFRRALASAEAEQRENTIDALGLIKCAGCSAAILPEHATAESDSAVGTHRFCVSCVRSFPEMGARCVYQHGCWWYGFGDRFALSGGYKTAAEAERALRRHVAGNLIAEDNPLAGLSLLSEHQDISDYLHLAAWHTTYSKLGRQCSGINDREFYDREHEIEDGYRAIAFPQARAA